MRFLESGIGQDDRQPGTRTGGSRCRHLMGSEEKAGEWRKMGVAAQTVRFGSVCAHLVPSLEPGLPWWLSW